MPRCKQCYIMADDILLDVLEDDPLTVSFDVQEVLYEMTLRYLLEKPQDVLEFCYDYVNQLLKARHTSIIYAERQPDDVLGETYWLKRNAVAGTYPTEDDEVPTSYPKSAEEIAFITKSLIDVFPFKYLDVETFGKVINLMYLENINPGRRLTIQGKPSFKFFLIEEGQFTATITDEDYTRNVRTYEDCGYFSLDSLLYDCTSEETVFANSEGRLWVLDQKAYRGAMVSADREERKTLKELLPLVPLFVEMTEEELELMMDCMSAQDYSDGERLIQEGEYPHYFYLVLSGRVILSKQDPSNRGDLRLRELQRGDFFGEHVLLTIEPSSYSARTCAETRLALLKVDAFETLFGPCLRVMQRNMETYQELLTSVLGEGKHTLRQQVVLI